MNYLDCKKLKREIDKQKLRLAEVKESGSSITVSLSDMPKGGTSVNRTELAVENIEAEEIKLKKLEQQLRDTIDSIPDEYIRKIIDLKINKGKSWTWIAVNKGNGSKDSIRKMCVRYFW